MDESSLPGRAGRAWRPPCPKSMGPEHRGHRRAPPPRDSKARSRGSVTPPRAAAPPAPEETMSGPRAVRAPRGTTLRCKGWPQEAALRMLMNNLDPEVAERPDDLVVYGGTGKAARSWDAFDIIV